MPYWNSPAGYIVMAQCLFVLVVIVAIVVGIARLVMAMLARIGGRAPR